MNVVISVAALTGVPLYLPIIWTLFSKRQTAGSVMAATLVSLLLNGFFKFATPVLFDFSFSRAEEMATGVLFPVMILTGWELWSVFRGKQQTVSENMIANVDSEKKDDIPSSDENTQGLKVIGIGIAASGSLIFILGLLASHGQYLVSGIASILMILGSYCICKSWKNNIRKT